MHVIFNIYSDLGYLDSFVFGLCFVPWPCSRLWGAEVPAVCVWHLGCAQHPVPCSQGRWHILCPCSSAVCRASSQHCVHTVNPSDPGVFAANRLASKALLRMRDP